MKKEKTQIILEDFPQAIRKFLENANIYDSSGHSGAKVLYSDLGYYVKIAGKGKLKKEAELARIFARRRMGVEVEAYCSEARDYLVTRAAAGEDATHYLENPEKLCEVLADAMKFLHCQPLEEIPVSICMEQYAELGLSDELNCNTLIHGDFCLPNVMLEDGTFRSFIDVGAAGMGDKHIDLYWAIWSLWYNLKTERYTDYFLDLYGREMVDMGILKRIAEVEASV